MTTTFQIVCRWCAVDDRQHPFAALREEPAGERWAEKVFGPLVDRRGKLVGGRRRLRYWNRCLSCGSMYAAPPPGYADRVAFRRLEKLGQTNLFEETLCKTPTTRPCKSLLQRMLESLPT